VRGGGGREKGREKRGGSITEGCWRGVRRRGVLRNGHREGGGTTGVRQGGSCWGGGRAEDKLRDRGRSERGEWRKATAEEARENKN